MGLALAHFGHLQGDFGAGLGSFLGGQNLAGFSVGFLCLWAIRPSVLFPEKSNKVPAARAGGTGDDGGMNALLWGLPSW